MVFVFKDYQVKIIHNYKYISTCKNNVEKKVVIDELKNEYKEGDVVGKCEIYLDNEKIGEVSIYCDRNIKKGNILDNIKYNITHLFGDKKEDTE